MTATPKDRFVRVPDAASPVRQPSSGLIGAGSHHTDLASLELVESGKLKTVIEQTLPLAAALRHIETGHACGKRRSHHLILRSLGKWDSRSGETEMSSYWYTATLN